VVLTDIRMPPDGVDEGIQAAERLRQTHTDVGVVVLSQYSEPRYALVSLTLRGTLPVADVRRLYQGIAEQARRFSCAIAGGDISGTLGLLTLTATLVGRTLRVPGADPADVRRALGPVEASVTVAPATLEERFFELTLTSSRTRESA